MIPSSGNDVTLDKYRRMPQPKPKPDVTTDAPTSSTSSAPKRTALTDSEDKGSQKKTRLEQGVSLDGQTHASSSSSSFQSGAVTREVRSTLEERKPWAELRLKLKKYRVLKKTFRIYRSSKNKVEEVPQ